MEQLTLVVLAAGMGTRFGKGVKQLASLGENGETLLDYSVRDAARAGFGRALFIIREDIADTFAETIGARAEKLMKVDYVVQRIDTLPERFLKDGRFAARTKPWGTGQALYCCKDAIFAPFGVINADDYYGAAAMEKLAGFLRHFTADACSIDYTLGGTLSENGTVNRAVCFKGEDGILTNLEETKGIARDDNGVIRGKYCGEDRVLKESTVVSMSMWGFGAEFMGRLAPRFEAFLDGVAEGDLTAEFRLPDAVSAEMKENSYKVRSILSDSEWIGITYESDLEYAKMRMGL